MIHGYKVDVDFGVQARTLADLEECARKAYAEGLRGIGVEVGVLKESKQIEFGSNTITCFVRSHDVTKTLGNYNTELIEKLAPIATKTSSDCWYYQISQACAMLDTIGGFANVMRFSEVSEYHANVLFPFLREMVTYCHIHDRDIEIPRYMTLRDFDTYVRMGIFNLPKDGTFRISIATSASYYLPCHEQMPIAGWTREIQSNWVHNLETSAALYDVYELMRGIGVSSELLSNCQDDWQMFV